MKLTKGFPEEESKDTLFDSFRSVKLKPKKSGRIGYLVTVKVGVNGEDEGFNSAAQAPA